MYQMLQGLGLNGACLGFMDEEGRLTSGEGARPCVESVTVKEIISKVDINKDGVLAAALAWKLGKRGYVL